VTCGADLNTPEKCGNSKKVAPRLDPTQIPLKLNPAQIPFK